MRRLPHTILALGIGLTTACTETPPPDRLFVNARIWTGDATRPEATAIAIRARFRAALRPQDA